MQTIQPPIRFGLRAFASNDIPPLVAILNQVLTDAIPHPLLCASISGAHLYGFASPDSDVDLRADPKAKAW